MLDTFVLKDNMEYVLLIAKNGSKRKIQKEVWDKEVNQKAWKNMGFRIAKSEDISDDNLELEELDTSEEE